MDEQYPIRLNQSRLKSISICESNIPLEEQMMKSQIDMNESKREKSEILKGKCLSSPGILKLIKFKLIKNFQTHRRSLYCLTYSAAQLVCQIAVPTLG
jgi:hypothetical protein